jgi:hypothetical protein
MPIFTQGRIITEFDENKQAQMHGDMRPVISGDAAGRDDRSAKGDSPLGV